MRLIDADRLNARFNIDDMTNINGCVPILIAKETIENAPTVDAVQVVRCRDCIYCCDFDGITTCNKDYGIHHGGWFCADGERRTDE